MTKHMCYGHYDAAGKLIREIPVGPDGTVDPPYTVAAGEYVAAVIKLDPSECLPSVRARLRGDAAGTIAPDGTRMGTAPTRNPAGDAP